jgi:hypothetical protein
VAAIRGDGLPRRAFRTKRFMARLLQNSPVHHQGEPLTPAQLAEALRAADPAAFLVSPRILRRVIKQHTGVGGIGLRVPHRKTYVISRGDLLAIADPSDLDLDAGFDLTDPVILIARPTVDALSDLRPAEALVKFWRQLFHARIHLALDELHAEGKLSDNDVRHRIQQIGATEFEEIRTVLRQEDFLLSPKDDRTVYVEFVAVYLELRYFLPSFLRGYFPSLEGSAMIDELLKQDVDGESLMAATRLAGASDRELRADAASLEPHGWRERVDEPQPAPRRLPARQRSDRTAEALLRKADRVSKLGNLVRAAILRTRAARYATPELAHVARDKARVELGRLSRRLQAALGFTDHEADEWSKSLFALLEQAARGIWTAEARMLYDLQKVCVDHERGIYSLDIVGWVTSLGRQSIKRFLPGQRDVLVSKHLRSALRRLGAAHVSNRTRSRLAALLHAAVHRAEGNLRARFKPVIDSVLDQVKLLPQNPPERVARKMLVDEILDRIVDRGFLSMGDLRDALSRNNLKLPDLSNFRQFMRGDQLLRADSQLSESLDGVYRGGEGYLRWPQRLSSLAFGTPAGRAFTRYVALPFGGAYVVLEALQHVIAPVARIGWGYEHVNLMGWHTPEAKIRTTLLVLGLGIFMLGLLQSSRFRSLCVSAVVHAGELVRRAVVDLPAWMLRMPWLRQIAGSWPFQLCKRFLLKPLVVSLFVAPLIAAMTDWRLTWKFCGVTFVIINFVLNSRLGRNVDEMVTDWVVLTWHRIRIYVVAAMFRLVMDVFNRILESIERLLYTVDEWLRFRAGERPAATAAKAVLGFVWFFVNYVVRFCVTLIIEPQVNPIKHFPVVTVSHKVMLSMILALQTMLEGPLGNFWAWGIALFAQILFPGIAGFLVWELKGNWRLYAANRPRDLRPVVVGHHGETLVQFLRPGFHSGTLPKLYARLRKASRKAYWTENWKSSSKQLDGLHHASESLRRFVDRELLALLHESRSWADRSITTGEIRLGVNRILIELYCPALGEDSMWLAFEEQAGWLVASVYRRGWCDALSQPRRHTLNSALAGFYKMAGVNLVREQIEAGLDPTAPGYEITDEALIVWPSHEGPRHEYPLGDWPALEERVEPNRSPWGDRDHWVFAAAPISWRRWVVTWELDQLGGFSKHHVLENLAMLPN